MEKSKLMRPLFYENFFNRNGRKMRAVYEREVSNGTETYRLWRSAGKPELEHNSAENDRYILYAEINGYLAPLGMTDWALIRRCGSQLAEKELYGGSKERTQYFDDLRKSDKDEGVLSALRKEEEVIKRYGKDGARQADCISEHLNSHVQIYLEAKENGGKTFPDFVGALVMDELANCKELSCVFRTLREEQAKARAAAEAEKERVFCEEQNRQAEEAISTAVNILQNGGVLKNDTITFYRSRYDSSTYSIFNYLMRLYEVKVPLRTQGWINDKLLNVKIEEGRCAYLRFLRARGGQCSQKFVDCMNELIRAAAVQEQPLAG